MFSILALAAALSFQDAGAAAEAYRACADIKRNRARLACYDEAANADRVVIARRQRAEEPAEEVRREPNPPVVAAPTAPQQRETIDRELEAAQRRAREAEQRAAAAEAELRRAEERAKQNAPIPDRFEAGVEAVRMGLRGELLVLLDNGQVWRQLTSDRKINERRLDRIQRVEVEKSPLGAWRMRLEPLGSTIQVRPQEDD